MGTRLWNSFKTMNEANVYINSIIDGDMSIEYSYQSNINFTINGTIISNILELDSDNNKNIFVFENNGCNSLIFLINQNEKENNLFTKNIWNWKVFFCLLVDNYFMIDDTNPILEKTILSSDFKINGLDSLNSFYNILHNNLDWKSFKNELKQISKNTTKNIDTINQKTYIFGIAHNENEKKEIIQEAKQIVDLEELVSSILLVSELSRQRE